jgi:hypothetical protein
MSAHEIKQQGFNYQGGLAIRISKFPLKGDGKACTQARGDLASGALDAEVSRQPLFHLRRYDYMQAF